MNADVASRVFRAFVADVERNLESFVRGGTTELDGSLIDPGGSVFGGVRWDLGPSTSSGARAVGCRLASTGHLPRCLAIVRGGHLPALVFEATARLSSVRRGGRMLVGNDADVADGVAVACAVDDTTPPRFIGGTRSRGHLGASRGRGRRYERRVSSPGVRGGADPGPPRDRIVPGRRRCRGVRLRAARA